MYTCNEALDEMLNDLPTGLRLTAAMPTGLSRNLLNVCVSQTD